MAPIIGFVGYGNINATLATLAVKAGYQVVISNSRGPETLVKAVAKLGSQAKAASVTDTIKQSDIVSVSIPLNKFTEIPAEPTAGKILIDSMNYYPQRDGINEDLENRSITNSELVQRHFKDAKVVKAFNNILYTSLYYGARPAGDPTRWCLPIAGDDEAAKNEVSQFIDAIGFDSVDIGSLADSWRFQRGTPVYCTPYIGSIPESATVEEMIEFQKNDHSSVVNAESVRVLTKQAVKDAPWQDPNVSQVYHAAITSGTLTAELRGDK